MNTITGSEAGTSRRLDDIKDKLKGYRVTPDVVVFFLLLMLVNTHLLQGSFNPSLIFLPSSVVAGEWWRLIMHPLVHISWYHLLLDAGAFFLLYRDLGHKNTLIKMYYVIMCGACGLIAPLLISPQIHTQGLCGLSGIAHGLMAVSALEMVQDRHDMRIGLLLFSLVVIKSIYETIHGEVIFSFLHMGLCGTPLAACHAGGVLGGIFAFCITKWSVRFAGKEEEG